MVRLLLRFDQTNVDKPITSEVILEQKTPINILSARINQTGGEILIDIPPETVDEFSKSITSKGVNVSFPNLINKDDELCIDCGSCISLCPVDAYSYEEDYSVNLDHSKCIGSTCGKCVDTCPREALKLL
jgi:NAD-dependent dihydropyrimidine dehydrogenase PreA subunit